MRGLKEIFRRTPEKKEIKKDRFRYVIKENPVTKIIDFFLTPEEEERFKEQVRRAQGKIRIIVHPFYFIGPGEAAQDFYDNIEKLCLEEQKELILLQEDQYTGIKRKFFKQEKLLDYTRIRLKETKANIWFVPTWRMSATPDKYYNVPGGDMEAKNWNEYADFLKKMGVNKIIVDGMWLTAPSFEEDMTTTIPFRKEKLEEMLLGQYDNQKINFPHGCVVQIIKELNKRGIDVEPGEVTYPEQWPKAQNNI